MKKKCCVSVFDIEVKENAWFSFNDDCYLSLALDCPLSQVIGLEFTLNVNREILIELEGVNYKAEIVTYTKDESNNLLNIMIRNIIITDSVTSVSCIKFDLICCNKKHLYLLPDKISTNKVDITIKSYPKQHKSKITAKFREPLENDEVARQAVQQLRTFFAFIFATQFYENNVAYFTENKKYTNYYISRCKKDSAYFLGDSRITVLDYGCCFEKWTELWPKYSNIILILEFLQTNRYEIVDMYYSLIFSALEGYFAANEHIYKKVTAIEFCDIIARIKQDVQKSNLPQENKDDINNVLKLAGDKSLKNRCYYLIDLLSPRLKSIGVNFNDDTDSLREIFKVLVDTRNHIIHRFAKGKNAIYLYPNDPKGNFVKSIWFLREFIIIALLNEVDEKYYDFTPAFMKSVTNWYLETIHEYIKLQKENIHKKEQ